MHTNKDACTCLFAPSAWCKLAIYRPRTTCSCFTQVPIMDRIFPEENEQPNKLRRLATLKNTVPYVSQSALCAVISYVSEHGAPDTVNRKQLRKSMDAVAIQETLYGQLIKPIELTCKAPPHGAISFDPTCSFGMLHCTAKTKHFGELLQATARKKPPSLLQPWRLVIYCDEVTPRQALKAVNDRMLQCIYYTLLEFGSAALAKEDNLIVCLPRSSQVTFAKSTVVCPL